MCDAGAVGAGHRRDRSGACRDRAWPSTRWRWCGPPGRAGTVRLGASPRAAISLLRAAQAYAVLGGRAYVTPSDVQAAAVPSLAHRLVADAGGVQGTALVSRVAAETPVPRREQPAVARRTASPASLPPPGLGRSRGRQPRRPRCLGRRGPLEWLRVGPGARVGGGRRARGRHGRPRPPHRSGPPSCASCPSDAVAGQPVEVEFLANAPFRLRPRSLPGQETRSAGAPSGSRAVTMTLLPERRGVLDRLVVEVASSAPFGLLWWGRDLVVPLPRPLHVAPRWGPEEPASAASLDRITLGRSPVPTGPRRPPWGASLRGRRPPTPRALAGHRPRGRTDGARNRAGDRGPRRHRRRPPDRPSGGRGNVRAGPGNRVRLAGAGDGR